MRSTLHSILVVALSLGSAHAFAQDGQTGGAVESAPMSQNEAAAAGGSVEQSVGGSSGGFMGFGEKKLQRMKSVPLPSSRTSRPLFASSQSSGVREVSPSFPARRSKPSVGELSTDFPARMIYLNGRNISAVREQRLEGVNVRIDANGNLHIAAPHYEVQESTHYRPLLPRDIPRVSKPAPRNDEPLLSGGGRFSKAPANGDASKLSSPGAVPPVEVDEDTAEETQPRAAPARSAVPSVNGTGGDAQKL